jgi:2-polyprenyl-6-methoxyphenol hydroxylase-like FAD-dependent oxidoreductase
VTVSVIQQPSGALASGRAATERDAWRTHRIDGKPAVPARVEEMAMANIVVTGGGMIGLSTAMLLAGDGHQVTVLERDPADPPAPNTAWEQWERRGVNQFRMLHFLLPGFHQVAKQQLPAVIDALDAAGAYHVNLVRMVPDELTGGERPGDEAYELATARRPVAEAAVAAVAAATPGVTIRRGVAVRGLLTGAPTAAGIPHVVGVVTDTGEERRADLVVDATGRRSSLPQLLTTAGARPVAEELDDCGFIYYGRHFRSDDGSYPPAIGAFLQHYDSLSILTLPADNGTWGVGIVTSAKDGQLRALRDVDTWTRTVKSFPLIAHWLDGTPLDDDVAVMAKIEDRHRDFTVAGTPVATGVLAVGDSWACTNPSVGRGISIGLLHAVALRDLLRTGSLDVPLDLATSWHGATMATVEPWYRETLAFDRHRLSEIDAQIEGREYQTDDPGWQLGKCLGAGAAVDGDLLRAALRVGGVVETGEEVFATPGIADKAMNIGGPLAKEPAPGPSREQLMAIVAG